MGGQHRTLRPDDDELMTKHLPIVLVLCLASCGNPGGDREPRVADETPPEVLLEVYDSLALLETPDHPGWNAAISQAARHSKHIWPLIADRLEVLAASAIFKPGEKVTQESREQRQQARSRYVALRRSLAKLAGLHPEDRALALLVHYMDEDIPEALEVLKTISGFDHGFNRDKWVRWFTQRQLKSGTPDTQQALKDWRDADPETRTHILKTYLSFTKEIRIRTLTESLTSSGSSSVGTVTSRDRETLRLQALAVLLEALKSSNGQHANMAFLGLIQVGDLALDAVMDLVDSGNELSLQLKGISILGHSGGEDLARKMLEWSLKPELRAMSLQALGNLDLDDDERKKVLKELHGRMTVGLSAQDSQKLLAAMILLGETERFPLLLSQCPENEGEKILISSRNVKDHGWLQIRRIARKVFDKALERKNRSMGLGGKGGTSFNPEAEFHRFAKKNNLTLNHGPWKEWARKALVRFP